MTKDEALSHYLTTRALARALDMRENTVSEWKVIPHVHQLRLESITGGTLRADDEAWHPASPRYSVECYSTTGRRKPYMAAAKP
jgi:hypothetical protein